MGDGIKTTLRPSNIPCARRVLAILSRLLPASLAAAHMLIGGTVQAAGPPIYVDDSINDGLAAHWKFDEPGSGTAREIVLGANGVLSTSAAMTFGPLPSVDFSDSAVLRLNGLTGTVDVADNAALNTATSFSFTVALWVQRAVTDVNTASTLYDSGTQAGHWYVGFLNSNALAFTKNAVADFASSHVVTDTDWHHVAFARDSAGNVTIYLDGIAAPPVVGGAIAAPSGPKIIGNRQTGNTPLAGYVDDLRIYQRALTATEVQLLAAGKGCVTDGASWATAFRELGCGLLAATAGSQVWIGEGVYKPSLYRFSTYLLKPGVDLYGGFRGLSPGGNEASIDQRPPFDPNAPLTTLSGDILDNDVPAGFSGYGDNQVVVVLAPTGSAGRIDGLRIRSGNADGVAGGLSNNGGGLRIAPGAAVTLSNMAFFANRSNFGGGAIFSQAPLHITGTHFISNTSENGYGGAIHISATLRLTRSTFLSNTTSLSGGAVYVDVGAGSTTVTDSSFRANRATTFDGGAIFSTRPLTMVGTTFANNRSAFSGGAVYAQAALAIGGSTFQGNTANMFDGGAVYGLDTAIITGSTFLSNTARFSGGAVSAPSGSALIAREIVAQFNNVTGANCSPTCTLGNGGALSALGPITLTGSILSGNSARLFGGAVAGGSSVAFISNTFSANTAAVPADAANPGKGGAIFVTGLLTDVGSRIERNQSTQGGGAYVSSTLLTLGSGVFSGTVFMTNSAVSRGGAVAADGPLTITGASFISNTVTSGDGGGVNAAAGAIVVRSVFERNSALGANGDGGAAFINPAPLIASGNVYSGNSAGRLGGAVFAAGEVLTREQFIRNRSDGEGGALVANASMTVAHGIFDGNTALLSGAISSDGPADRSRQLNVFNSLFIRNGRSSTSGAADMRLFDLTIRLINNTFADPEPGSTPAAVVFRSTITLTNNIFSNYGRSVLESSAGGTTTLQVDYNLFDDAPLGLTIVPGTGNITATAEFVDRDAGDYRLKLSSPAIDAGRNSAVPPSITTDLAGQPRFINIPLVPGALIAATPQTVDMGAYERQLGVQFRTFMPSVRRSQGGAW